MGGGGGGSRSIGDIRSLVEEAKEELRKGDDAGKRKNVFISFAYEDIDEVNLLRGQAKNEKSTLEFNDWSVPEAFDSERAEYIKKKIGDRISRSSLTIVYLSDHSSNSQWVDWEIEESIRREKTVIGVHKGNARPAKLPGAIERHNINVIPWSMLTETISNIE